MNDSAYVLGHSDQELSRLKLQAQLLAPVTRQFFRDAGVVEGMRVLDIGSGGGDVAFLTAELIGGSGEVIGIDKAAAAVTAARLRALAQGLGQVSFRLGDPAQMRFDYSFDAIVGRYVLLFQADPIAMMRSVVAHARPGGLVVFHEPDWLAARSAPAAPLYERCCEWIKETFRQSGTDTNMAAKLHPIFVGAGLQPPSMRMQTFIGAGARCSNFLHAVAQLVAVLAPSMERLGIASAAEINVDTLNERLHREVHANASVIIGRSEIAAWSRV